MDYWQYFIDTSQDVNKTGRVCNKVEYKTVRYGKNKKHDANYCVLFDSARNVIQVHFEKTSTKQDWKDNFNFPQKQYDSFVYDGKPLTLYVHSGWGNMYRAVKHDMHVDFEEMQKEHPGAIVEVIGWSLGSALAQLCVQDLNFRYGRKADCYTFGSVKPWFYTDRRTDAYLKSCWRTCMNFCHRSDIVTYQPPFPGYHMLNRIDVGKFFPAGLLDPWQYHTHYDDKKLYENFSPQTY